MRRVFLWAARNRWLKERLPRFAVHARAVRRFMPGETMDDALDGGRAAPGRRDRHDVHAARREPREPRRGRRGRRPLPRRSSTGSWPPGSTARSRSSRPSSASTTTPTPASAHLVRLAEHAAAAGSYLWIDMEGSAYTDADDRPVRAAARDPAEDRHLPPGVPAADGRRHRAAAARSTRPSAWSRAPTTRRQRSPTATGASVDCELRRRSPSGSCSTVAAGRSGWASGPTTWSSIEQIADAGRRRPASAATGSRSRCCTASGPDEQFRLAKAGYRVQTLIAYGEHWYPWYMRRLAERPANVTFALRSMLPVGQEAEMATVSDRRVAARMGTIGTESAFEVSARARALEAQGRSIIHLEIGEPDFDTPANVREAAKRALDAGATHYAPFAGHPGPARGDRGRRDGRARASPVDPSQVVRHASAARASCSTRSSALVDPGDEVIVPDPGYPIYESMTRFVGGDAGARSRSARSTTSGSTSTSSRRSSRRGPGCSSSTRRPTRPAAS